MKKILLSLSLFCLPFTLSFSEEKPTEKKEKVIVYTDIVGDMLHYGHIEFFKKAKAFGDYLIVGVLADDVVEGYKRNPILTLEERVRAVEACKYVDEVIVAPPLRLTEEMIKELNISIVARGDDFSPELLEDQYSVSMKLGILRLVPYTPGISSTNIIDRIVTRYNEGEFRKGK